MRHGQRTCLAPDGTDVGGLTTIQTDALVQYATAHGIALYVVVVAVDEGVLFLQFIGSHVGMSLGIANLEVLADGFESLGALVLLQSLLCYVISGLVALLLHLLAKVLVVHFVAVFALHVGTQFLAKFLLQAAHGFDGLVGSLQGTQQVLFAHFLHLTFHHHDVFFGGAHHEVHIGLLQLGEGGIDDILTIDASYSNFGDGTLEGYVADSQSGRGGQASQRIGHIHANGGEENNIYINLSMIVAGEEGTQGAVHKTTSQNLVVVSLTLALRESARKASGCGILFSVLYLQGHEICSGNGIFGGAYSGQEHGVVHANDNGTIGLFRQFPGLDADGPTIRQLDCLCNNVHLNLCIKCIKNMR